jgi:hypothetical protein
VWTVGDLGCLAGREAERNGGESEVTRRFHNDAAIKFQTPRESSSRAILEILTAIANCHAEHVHGICRDEKFP